MRKKTSAAPEAKKRARHPRLGTRGFVLTPYGLGHPGRGDRLHIAEQTFDFTGTGEGAENRKSEERRGDAHAEELEVAL